MERPTRDTLRYRDLSLAGLLERQHGLRLDEKPNPGSAQMTLSATATKPTPDQRGAIIAITEALQPATRGEIEDALVRLGENVAAPYGSDPDTRLEEWTAFLLGYPADVVICALNEWPDTHRDWPKRAEIKPILDALSLRRRRMLTAIQAFSATQGEDDLYPEPSDEDRAAVRAIASQTIAKLTAAAKPKRPAKSPVEQRLEFERECERKAIERALHGDADA